MAQNNGFPFGKVSYNDLNLSYTKDTSAYAVVLREFGEAYIDNGREHNLIFEYHTVIKNLKKQGLKLADITIDLRHQDNSIEYIRTSKASSYNIENGSLRETPLDTKSVHTVKLNNYWDQMKFAIPNVRVGSVIEIS